MCNYFESGLPPGLKMVARPDTISSIRSPSCKAERLHWIQITSAGKRPRGDSDAVGVMLFNAFQLRSRSLVKFAG